MRAAGGFAAALLVAALAWRVKLLAPTAVATAVAMGAVTAAAGWRWAVALLAYFLVNSAAGLYRRHYKASLVGDIVDKPGRRDAAQLLANGGVFSALALAQLAGAPSMFAAALGSLAASTADSWGTEVGLLSRRAPRSILSGRPLVAGESGGVTAAGLVATALGSLAIAVLALLLDVGAAAAAAVGVAGVLGALADSALGASLQERRWCEGCGRSTEQLVHSCGRPTRYHSGVPRVRNDLVNLAAAVVGAVSTWAVLSAL